MLTSEESVSSQCRFFIPFIPKSASFPEVVEIDIQNGSICLIYGSVVPNDDVSKSFANEFAGALKDTFALLVEKDAQSALANSKIYRIGIDEASLPMLE